MTLGGKNNSNGHNSFNFKAIFPFVKRKLRPKWVTWLDLDYTGRDRTGIRI